jgi:hypothetical protein
MGRVWSLALGRPVSTGSPLRRSGWCLYQSLAAILWSSNSSAHIVWRNASVACIEFGVSHTLSIFGEAKVHLDPGYGVYGYTIHLGVNLHRQSASRYNHGVTESPFGLSMRRVRTSFPSLQSAQKQRRSAALATSVKLTRAMGPLSRRSFEEVLAGLRSLCEKDCLYRKTRSSGALAEQDRKYAHRDSKIL